MTITDEMVELAFQTYYEAMVDGGERALFRAVLEAVAPMILAQDRRGDLQLQLDTIKIRLAEIDRILSPKVNQVSPPDWDEN